MPLVIKSADKMIVTSLDYGRTFQYRWLMELNPEKFDSRAQWRDVRPDFLNDRKRKWFIRGIRFR